MLLVKLIVTPVLMWLVSLVGRRWGGLAAGTASGLPLTSGPISIYLAIEQSPGFARAAAEAGLGGAGAVMVSFAAYAAAVRRLGTAAACACGLAAFAAVGTLSYFSGFEVVSCLVGLLAWVLILRLPAAPPDLSQAGRRSPLDLPARIGVSTILVLGVTTFARYLGPGLSGLVAPVPVIAWPLLVFEHVQQGRAGAIAVAKGAATGMLGVLAFYAVVARCLGPEHFARTYVAAFVAAIVVSTAAVALSQCGVFGSLGRPRFDDAGERGAVRSRRNPTTRA